IPMPQDAPLCPAFSPADPRPGRAVEQNGTFFAFRHRSHPKPLPRQPLPRGTTRSSPPALATHYAHNHSPTMALHTERRCHATPPRHAHVPLHCLVSAIAPTRLPSLPTLIIPLLSCTISSLDPAAF